MYIYSFEENVPLKSCKEKQYSFLRRAMNLAHKSTCENQHHGCVIVRDDEIIAEGFNYKKEFFNHRFSIHAEVAALSKLSKKNKKFLSTCDLYVVRIGTDNMGNPLKYSKPCPECMKAILKAGIRKVYYSSNIEFEQLYAELYNNPKAASSSSDSCCSTSTSISSS